MANLNIEIDDGVLMKLLNAASNSGESLEAYLERILAKDQEDDVGVNLEDALVLALDLAKKLEPGTEFTLQELFGEDWGNVSSPRWVGRKFRTEIEQAGTAQFISKTVTNKAINRRS